MLGLVGGLTLASLLAGDTIVLLVALLAAVFGMYYFFIVSYTIGIFCVTVFLGLLYSLLGASLEPLLVLRLEETAIGRRPPPCWSRCACCRSARAIRCSDRAAAC